MTLAELTQLIRDRELARIRLNWADSNLTDAQTLRSVAATDYDAARLKAASAGTEYLNTLTKEVLADVPKEG